MKTTIELPLLPLRDVVVYPHMVIPLFVGREKSIEALEAAMTGDKQILLLAQKNPADDDPGEDALYRGGTIATWLLYPSEAAAELPSVSLSVRRRI